MIENISQSRFLYEKAYRRMRLQGGHYQEEEVRKGVSDEQECALLSYDCHDSEFSGWINRQRYQQWIATANVYYFDKVRPS